MLGLIVCGSRTWSDRGFIEERLERLRGSGLGLVIEGRARGADRLAGDWAARFRREGIAWLPFYAEWEKHGLKAGKLRNAAMLEYLLQFQALGHRVGVLGFVVGDELTRGTAHMVWIARNREVTCVVYNDRYKRVRA